MSQQFTIRGMTCTGCTNTVTAMLKTIPHVLDVEVHLDTGLVELTADQNIDRSAIESVLSPFSNYKVMP